jgi:hypothetical protein
MATLNNPVNAQNIVDRFADYVVSTANSGIVWGTNNIPFTEFGEEHNGVTASSYFGGTTSGKEIAINGSNVNADPITASTIYNALVAETNAYTRIRNLQAKLNVDGGGGNTGTRPTAGVVFDETNVANMNSDFLQTTANNTANAGVSSGSTIDDTNLETFFDNLRTAYSTARANTTVVQVDVCHASCHSSCHSSRGRR